MQEENEVPKYSNKISVSKFIILNIIFFTFYELVWIYRSWKFFKEKEQSNISPLLRTIFSIFFIYPLFKKILDNAQETGYEKKYSPGLRTFFWIGIHIPAYFAEIYFFIAFLSFIAFISPLNAMNHYLSSVEKNCQQRKWKWWSIILAIFAIILWILVIIGSVTQAL